LTSIDDQGWIFVDLDVARRGPLAGFDGRRACIVRHLEPIDA
jgi:hypothetical protein